MVITLPAGVLFCGACALGLASATALNIPTTHSCEESPTQLLLPTVVASMIGNSPAWMVDGRSGRWESGASPVKTLWVLKRTAQEVRIEGHRLDGTEILMFRRGQNQPTNTLVIANPSEASVRPRGAPPSVLSEYSFIPSHVFYPSPGCWRFTIRIGDEEAEIVHEVKSGR